VVVSSEAPMVSGDDEGVDNIQQDEGSSTM
jgi:hypothetical protein